MVAYLRRSEAIKAAYDAAKNMKEARPAIKTAFDTWRETVKQARETLKKERQDRWAIFKEDVKKCRPDKRNEKEATQDSSGQQRSEGNVL
jgi:gas vesicle protein